MLCFCSRVLAFGDDPVDDCNVVAQPTISCRRDTKRFVILKCGTPIRSFDLLPTSVLAKQRHHKLGPGVRHSNPTRADFPGCPGVPRSPTPDYQARRCGHLHSAATAYVQALTAAVEKIIIVTSEVVIDLAQLVQIHLLSATYQIGYAIACWSCPTPVPGGDPSAPVSCSIAVRTGLPHCSDDAVPPRGQLEHSPPLPQLQSMVRRRARCTCRLVIAQHRVQLEQAHAMPTTARVIAQVVQSIDAQRPIRRVDDGDIPADCDLTRRESPTSRAGWWRAARTAWLQALDLPQIRAPLNHSDLCRVEKLIA